MAKKKAKSKKVVKRSQKKKATKRRLKMPGKPVSPDAQEVPNPHPATGGPIPAAGDPEKVNLSISITDKRGNVLRSVNYGMKWKGFSDEKAVDALDHLVSHLRAGWPFNPEAPAMGKRSVKVDLTMEVLAPPAAIEAFPGKEPREVSA